CASVRARPDDGAVRGPACDFPRRARAGDGSATGLVRAAEGGSEVGEELLGKLPGGAVDEPASKLGDLAANLRVDVVTEPRCAAVGIGQSHVGPALGEASDTALALAKNAVAIPHIHVGQVDRPFQAGPDGPDFHLDGGL